MSLPRDVLEDSLLRQGLAPLKIKLLSDDALRATVLAMSRPDRRVTTADIQGLLGCWAPKANRILDELRTVWMEVLV